MAAIACVAAVSAAAVSVAKVGGGGGRGPAAAASNCSGGSGGPKPRPKLLEELSGSVDSGSLPRQVVFAFRECCCIAFALFRGSRPECIWGEGLFARAFALVVSHSCLRVMFGNEGPINLRDILAQKIVNYQLLV